MGMGAMGGVSGMGSMGGGSMAAGGSAATACSASAGTAGAASPACNAGATANTRATQAYNQVDHLLNNIADQNVTSRFLKLALAMMLLDNLNGCDDRKHKRHCEDLGLVGALALGAALAGSRMESATNLAQQQNGASQAYTCQAVQSTSAMGASLNIMA